MVEDQLIDLLREVRTQQAKEYKRSLCGEVNPIVEAMSAVIDYVNGKPEALIKLAGRHVIYKCSCGSKVFERTRHQEITDTGAIEFECAHVCVEDEPDVLCRTCGKEAEHNI